MSMICNQQDQLFQGVHKGMQMANVIHFFH
jgi:hypothetical protein